MYGYICPHCGAHLDPAERCDCIEEREREQKKKKEMNDSFRYVLIEEQTGQLKIAV